MDINQKNNNKRLYSLLSQYISMSELEIFVRNLEPDDNLNCKLETSYFSATRWCLAALKELDCDYCNPKIISWAYNLQLGNTGFAEWPGEMAWDYTTFDISYIYNYLGLKPKKLDGFINYVKSFQNIDGGFSTLGGASNMQGTIHWTIALLNVGENNILKETTDFLRRHLFEGNLSSKDFYYTATILNHLEKISKQERRQIYRNIYKYLLRNHRQLDRCQKYWFCETLKLLVPGSELGFLHTLIPIDWGTEDPFSIYMAIRLSFLFRIPFDKDKAKQKIFAHTFSGGFKKETNLDIYTYAVAKQIISVSQEEKDRFVRRLGRHILKDGSQKNGIIFSLDPKINFRLVKAYLLMGGTIESKDVEKFMIENLTLHLQRKNLMSSYEILVTFKILKLNFPLRLKEYLVVMLKKISLYERMIMYRVFRQFLCFYIAQKSCPDLSPEKVFPDYNIFIKFILSCESSSGGFSHLPGEEAGMQPTYQALHLLKLFNVDIPHKKAHRSFLQKCFVGGGFSGKIGDNIPISLNTYYGLMSFLLLDLSRGDTLEIVDPLLFL